MPVALLVLEPFASRVLPGFGLPGIVVALTLKLSGDLLHFSFPLMMAVQIGTIVPLTAYHVLIGIFSR